MPNHYAYARLDIDGYVDSFTQDRRSHVGRLLGQTLEEASARYPDSVSIATAVLEQVDEPDSPENAVTTVSWLRQMLEVSVGREPDTAFLSRVRDALQRKFSVFGKVYAAYDPRTIRKRGSEDRDPVVYAMLGIVLGLRSAQTGDLNALNSALTVNDLLIAEPLAQNEVDRWLTGMSCLVEHQAVRNWRD